MYTRVANEPSTMIFKTLENLRFPQIAQLFNAAFADYFVKVELTPELLKAKVDSEDLRTDLSMGIFHDERPVAFMLHGLREMNGKKVAYNGGTGVIKEFRGQHATVKMYEQQVQILKGVGVDEIELEVIDKNIQAVKSYEKAGFRKKADLDCFMGKPKEPTKNNSLKIQEVKTFDQQLFQSFWDWQPSWQNASETIEKLANSITYGAFIDGELAGYLTAYPKRARVLQFAVAPNYRRQNIGSSLFHYFANTVSGEIDVNNIDDPTQNTQNFLKTIGLRHFLTQNKMTLKLES